MQGRDLTRGTTLSPWHLTEASAPPRRPSLITDARADACVVGAGITGLTTAYLLARGGLKVIVVDQGRVGGGETGRSTAHLTHVIDLAADRLIAKFGVAVARALWGGYAFAIRQIEDIAAREGIECDLVRVPGYLYADDEAQAERLDAIAKAIHSLDHPVLDAPPSGLPFAPRYLLAFPDQARLHPMKYAAGLARALAAMGVEIYENTRVDAVSDAPPHRVVTGTGAEVIAERVVVAAHVPFNNRLVLHTKQAAYRTYAIGVKIPPGSFPDGLFRDLDDPYHYVRLQPEASHDLLIVGGEDHKTGFGPATDPCDRLVEFALRRLKTSGEVLYRWSGQIMEPVDGLPFVGDNPGTRTEVVATGFSGDGMTGGTLAAYVMAERALGRTTGWDDILHPGRLVLHGVKDYLVENVDFPTQLLACHLRPETETRPVAALHAGEGGIFKLAGRRLAISRLGDGHLVALSPTCTHLGCHVHWNGVERTWDCPCHGSRFAPTGEVVNGPAHRPLEAILLAEVLAEEERKGRGTVSPGFTAAEDWAAT